MESCIYENFNPSKKLVVKVRFFDVQFKQETKHTGSHQSRMLPAYAMAFYQSMRTIGTVQPF